MLKKKHTTNLIEAGCDEAGRGCLAGPVFAAAVILPDKFRANGLNDSKLLKEKQRSDLRKIIESNAVCWAVAMVNNEEIDKINILNASILAMHIAINELKKQPELLLIDGNRFKPYNGIQHHCIVQGDRKYQSIAAASILAKTHRDDYMKMLHMQHPEYKWFQNKGYPTPAHKKVIFKLGITSYHRKSFRFSEQLKLDIN